MIVWKMNSLMMFLTVGFTFPCQFLYVNQSFAPAPDQLVRNLYQCFGSDGKLVLHYCRTQAWGWPRRLLGHHPQTPLVTESSYYAMEWWMWNAACAMNLWVKWTKKNSSEKLRLEDKHYMTQCNAGIVVRTFRILVIIMPVFHGWDIKSFHCLYFHYSEAKLFMFWIKIMILLNL